VAQSRVALSSDIGKARKLEVTKAQSPNREVTHLPQNIHLCGRSDAKISTKDSSDAKKVQKDS